jgi:LuxR family transcriptional regulator, maltose regulon positive regulatory protein
MVSQPIIVTKINVPFIEKKLVTRQRLFNSLNEGLNSKLVLICAPAGYGKSTLVSQWLKTCDECTAWISLDNYDDDWHRFFTYLISAIVKADVDFGTSSQDLLNSEKPLAINELVANFINDCSLVKNDCIVVFDDFHLISSNDILSNMLFLIENLPPKLHLIILTRSEPGLPISKFRSQRILTEIHASDLKFSLNESELFLKQVMNLDLDANYVSILRQRTEGWVVGLQLIALSLQKRADPSMFITSLTGKDRHIADYLVDEVLSSQSDDLQSFLLQTSIFERMCGPLCDEVLGLKNSQLTLETIERANLFIIPLDNSRDWYRYHHLFSELLRSKLERENKQKIKELYRKACIWFQKNDLLEEAVRYVILAEDYTMAVTIVEQIGHMIYWANRTDKLREWLNALPPEYIKNSFDLQILRAYDQINVGKVREADRTLEDLKNRSTEFLNSGNDEENILQGKLLSAFTSVKYHRYLAWEECYKIAKQSIELLPSSYTYERCVAYFHGGGSLIMIGDLENAESYLTNARQLSNSVQNPFAKLLTLSNQGVLMMIRGELKNAMAHFQEAHQFGKQCHASQEATYSNSVNGAATIYYEWNQLDKCFEKLEEAVELMEKDDFFDQILLNHETLLTYHCAKNDFIAAEDNLNRCLKLLTDNNITHVAERRVETLFAWFRWKKGDLAEAVVWADDFIKSNGDEVCFELELELMLYVRICIASGANKKTIEILQKMLFLAQSQGRLRSVIKITILLSVAYTSMSDVDKGLKNLILALQMAQNEGYIRSFIDEGEMMRSNLIQLTSSHNVRIRQESLVEYIQSLLGEFPEIEGKAKTKDALSDRNASYYSITPKEIEVLKLLNLGLTYAEISESLEITENTLKYHIKNIYGKLNVNKRIKAVFEAKRLGYL